ncbi:uncharacterized protein LOC120634916 [Pararge aegeria]|uniref:uncharacterized protein LOC120634916 n=1 Tax=Pararge aegeria TaxID=116150 RepID=UPI0019D13E74|nr:uncharacterized protein LOC120634916 [Pararge aegeria]
MNRTIVILNLLVSSISIARSIDEPTTAYIADDNDKIYDITLRIPDETAEVVVKNDDVLNTSELSNMFSLVENKFARTRSLKEESDDDRFIKAELKKESRVTVKSADSLDKPEGKESGNTVKAKNIETKAANKEESKSGDKSVPISKTAVAETKNSTEESKLLQTSTSELNDVESTTENFRGESKTSDYLENDKNEHNEKVNPDKAYARKGFDMPINDESNSAWDLLDDLPASRRMLSQPDYLDIESKGRNGVEKVGHIEPVQHIETKHVPEINVVSQRHHNSHGHTLGPPLNTVISNPEIRQATVSIPRNHQHVLPQRRFIVPGFIKIRPAAPIDFRRLINQERNNVLSQNVQYEKDYRTERNNVINQNQNIAYDSYAGSDMPLESREVLEDYNSKELSNAYPFTPAVSETPKLLQTTTVNKVNPLFAKLVDASEHPKPFTPNLNTVNVQNIPHNNYMAHNYYPVPQKYGIYKYVTGFGRSR